MKIKNKFLILALVTFVVINIQLQTPVFKNMDNGFSIQQLMKNILTTQVLANKKGICPGAGCRSGDNFCVIVILSDGTTGTCFDYGWPYQH